MGGGIAQSLAQSGVACTLLDVDPAAAEARRAQVLDTAADYLAKGFIDEGRLERLQANLFWSDDFETTVREADLVFEVVFERIDVKHEVLRRIEAAAAPEAIIATNTSAIPIGELAEALERPERFLGVHWFNPAPLLPGIEVIPHETTDRSVIPPILDMLRAAGKEPAVVSDTPGFVCNRLQFALFREAARMVEDGDASPEEIDTIVRASFGFRLALYGPFAVADMAGLDVYANSYVSLQKALGDRFSVPPSLQERVASGDLGIKSGGGYLGLDEDEARELVAARDNAYVQLSRLRSSLVESGSR
jgi:3-hydroxybutyryl-CoA dehydrogenase